ncbi:hypothetical protein NQ318_022445 [Aromia moschata]|uniref:URB1 C-terminal domain-containing protein n=1 Tax=Aromia moschata TaxID=1265417 RepID=A0AAV8Z7N9_9CUCU|nr:hypothetical protein NQ318_022445 [Aromia moschata]
MEMLSLFLVLCRNWNDFMERGHIPVLLAAYRAMVNKCDRMLLALLKMYESRAGQTGFYDFKPYLWGKAAASHYSVRLNIENALWRQPKMGDILDILEDHYVTSTITNYPVKENLHLTDSDISQTVDTKSYDLKFLLPLFSQLLAPEQQVQTYRFTRSGALSLAVVGLSSQDKEVRQAACHVLSRFHSHVDARQSGKDNLLWLRYIEAGRQICETSNLTVFPRIYLARMALVLTQPNHVMYIPLSQHLTAKASLDFGTVPELYTFLHSSDVNYREHRSFILELLRDGVRTEKDFTDFTRSMAFKLFSELYSSCVSDVETRLLILDVINAACKVPSGVKMLCENHSLLAQVYTEVHNILKRSNREKQDINGFINKIVGILISVVTVLHNKHSSFTIFNILMSIIKDDVFESLKVDIKNRIFEILTVVFSNFGELFSDDVLRILLSRNNNHFCKYILEYGCQFVNINEIDKSDEYYYMKLLFYNKIKN